jgi:hypothetical protein
VHKSPPTYSQAEVRQVPVAKTHFSESSVQTPSTDLHTQGQDGTSPF